MFKINGITIANSKNVHPLNLLTQEGEEAGLGKGLG
jgi:hypothetical protein